MNATCKIESFFLLTLSTTTKSAHKHTHTTLNIPQLKRGLFFVVFLLNLKTLLCLLLFISINNNDNNKYNYIKSNLRVRLSATSNNCYVAYNIQQQQPANLINCVHCESFKLFLLIPFLMVFFFIFYVFFCCCFIRIALITDY